MAKKRKYRTANGTVRAIKNGRYKKKILFEVFGDSCLACKLTLRLSQATLDHVIPLAMDGPRNILNMQILCQPCNRDKAGTVKDYRDKSSITKLALRVGLSK